jgi:hypothetical protein
VPLEEGWSGGGGGPSFGGTMPRGILKPLECFITSLNVPASSSGRGGSCKVSPTIRCHEAPPFSEGFMRNLSGLVASKLRPNHHMGNVASKAPQAKRTRSSSSSDPRARRLCSFFPHSVARRVLFKDESRFDLSNEGSCVVSPGAAKPT